MQAAALHYVVTETVQLSRALDVAATIWPSDKDDRTALLLHIIDEGLAAMSVIAENKTRKRVEEIHNVAGSMPGIWPDNWREQLRDEWPE